VDANFVMGIGAQVVWVALKLAGPILVAGLAVGLVVSVFQAATQIQEQTLAFVPKIAAVIVVLLVLGPWMLATLTDFAHRVLGNLDAFIR
jgi:flagellar biosynthetic protein FliQ